MLGCPCDYPGALGDGRGEAASVCPAANGTHACGAYPVRSLLDQLIQCNSAASDVRYRSGLEACAENQIRHNKDFNGPEQEGAGLYQVTQFWGGDRNGERCSAAAAYLHPV